MVSISSRLFTLAVIGAAVGVGCGSSEPRTCLSADAAEVCVVGSDGDLTIDTSGLQPGSELLISTDIMGEGTFLIVGSGSTEGAVGLLGIFGGETITISATAASGEQISGVVTVGK